MCLGDQGDSPERWWKLGGKVRLQRPSRLSRECKFGVRKGNVEASVADFMAMAIK